MISVPEHVVSTEKPAVETPTVEPLEVSELLQLLSEGRWELDRSWSVLSLTGPAIGHAGERSDDTAFRWRFQVPERLTPLPKPRDGLPAPVIPADPQRLALLGKYEWLWDSRRVLETEDLAQRWPNIAAALQQLSQRPDLVGRSAVILLARQRRSDADLSVSLEELVRSSPEPANPVALKQAAEMRCAAAETWCDILSRRDDDPEMSLAPAGRLLDDAVVPDELRAELWRGIARRIPPRQIPGLSEIMQRDSQTKDASSMLKLPALEACVIHAWRQHESNRTSPFDAERWPDGLRNARFADDVLQRKLYGRWAVLVHHPDALAVLKSQRLDSDLSVREAAVISLGLLDSPAARDELQVVMAKGTELEKIAAVSGLARFGQEEIAKYVRESSPRVRMAIAAALGKMPTRASGLILAEYLRDRSPEVQLASLAACETTLWGEKERVPLLLQALKAGLLKTRLAALDQLRREWGAEPHFPVDGSLEERDAAVRRLAAEHRVSAEVFTAFEPRTEEGASPDSQERRRSQIRQLVDDYFDFPQESEPSQMAREQLRTLDAMGAAVLEQELVLLPGPEAEEISREILSRLNSAYTALANMESRDAAVRRTAARQFKERAVQATLSPLVLKKLRSQLLDEQDQLVWSEVIAAILPDSTPEAAQIALVALNSQWPDVRQLGCEYLARHPYPEYALWLLPRLQDADRSVKLRAIQITADCGNPVALDGFADSPETIGLRQFLSSTDQQLRWEAVVAMSTLGDAQASQELIRQTNDPQPRQRERALRAIGRTGQTRFVELLLKQLWTETDPVVQLALLEALHQLVPMEEQPGLAPESPIGDKINHWTRWWEARQRSHRVGMVRPVSAGGRSH